MKKAFGIFLTLSLSWSVLAPFSLPTAHLARPDDPARLKALESYGKLPLSFVENKGQVDKKVSFYLKGSQGTIYFTKEAIIYDLISAEPGPSKREESRTKEVERLCFTLKPVGAREVVRLIANERLPGRVNYFIGSDPKGWRTDIPIYGEILYEGLFRGIDLRLYGTNNQMGYDFIVHPGADPNDIRMTFRGIEGLNVDEGGNLVIRTAFGDLRHLKPVIYQEIAGRRQVVEGSFKVAKKSFGFEIKSYNRDFPLIIDPVTLSYSTYLGGSADDYGYHIAVDTSGNAYVTGYTTSTDFPTEYPYQGTYGGGSDAYVTKLGPAGDTLSYSTYLGGNGGDISYDIAVDSSGNAYVTGNTYSADFPNENPYQGTYGGGSDAFVTKLGPAGDTLSYSTYLGGSHGDISYGIAVDSSGNAYVTGFTASTDFPTEYPYQGTFGGGTYDAFVTKLGPAGDTLSYSTYLGGSSYDYGFGIAVDSSGDAYVAGGTYSADFPTENPYQGTFGGGSLDAFVAKLVLPVILTTPNGGEFIPSGSIYTIRWVAPTSAVTFKLKYSLNNGKTWKLIDSGITDKSYYWQVPTPKKNKTKCLVMVIGYDALGGKVGRDKSDGTFTIEVLSVTSPNGGETLTLGSPHTITWTTNGTKKPVAKVILKYTKNGGRTWKKITTIEGSDPGTSLWTIPDVSKIKMKCKVKVVLKDAKGNKVGSDKSDDDFTIQP